MKKCILSVALFLIYAFEAVNAQSPVTWSYFAKKTGDKKYEIHLVAKLEDEWHIYSQTTPEGGPIPTAILFSKNPLLSLEGPVKEVGKMEEHFEPLFGVMVKQYSDKVEFVQTIKLKAAVKTAINGHLEFMICNDVECMPPTKKTFSIGIN